MPRALLALFAVAVTVASTGCASHKHAGKSVTPSSAAGGACGRKPFLCVDGFEQCTTDREGCETCTCTKAGGYNNLDPRMPP